MSKVLVVVGQGYVGLPMALRAAETGIRVLGLDTNSRTVAALNAGTSHIDDVSDSELQAGIAAGYRATDDASCITEADTVVVCVPTPLSPEGGPDLGAVGAARAISRTFSRARLSSLKSTTYPGTTEEVFAPLVCGEDFVPGRDVFIAFSPERIDPGNGAVRCPEHPQGRRWPNAGVRAAGCGVLLSVNRHGGKGEASS